MVVTMHPLTEVRRDAATAWFADEAALAATRSSGHVAMVERGAREGRMPPLLRRQAAETYRVLDGEVVFFVGDDVLCARAGDVVVAPPGVPRTFRVASPEAHWLVLTEVSSLERFHDFGRAVSRPLQPPAENWPSAEEHAVVAAAGAANGIELLGPPGALPS
jgi:mannose-6-phosphate isomerase-like protein (cupin superfamily)